MNLLLLLLKDVGLHYNQNLETTQKNKTFQWMFGLKFMFGFV